MSVSYYLTHKQDKCLHCNRAYEPVLIGQDSAGWAFALFVYPSLEIYDIDDWVKLWSSEDMKIIDEYGTIIDKERMYIKIVSKISLNKGAPPSQQMLDKNFASYDMNHYLLRADIKKLEAKYGKNNPCIANGKGTYDLYVTQGHC